MTNKIRILYIDDYQLDRELVKDVLEKEHGGFEVTEASNKKEFEELLKNREFDVVLSDFNIAGFEGLDVLEAVRTHNPGMPVIIVTGTGSEEIAVKALKQGASDYVIKRPRHIQKLPQTILAVIENMALRDQRRKDQTALMKSEMHYRSLFDNMMNGCAYGRMIFEQNKPQDYIYLDVNRAFVTKTGLKNVVGKKVSEVIPDIREADPELFERLGRVALTGKPESFEIYLKALSMWFSISVYSPEKEHFIAVFDVIDERKRTEEELKVNLIKYQTLFESLPIGVTVSDKAGKILESNKEALRLLALPHEEHSKRRIDGREWRIIRPDGTLMPKDEFASVRALKEKHLVGNVEMGIIRGEGDIIWINVTAAPIPIEPFGVIIAYNDITQQKLAEKLLQESEARLRFALEINNTGAWELDLSDHRINRTLIHDRIFGYEMLLPHWTYEMFLEHVLPEDRLNVERSFREAKEIQTIRNLECRIRRNDGEVRWIWIVGNDLKTSEGKPAQMLGLVQDITERKKMEEELLKSRKLDSVGLLAGGIAHDFNNILTTVIGNISLAKMQTKAEDEIYELLSEAETASVRAQRLTRQLLTFAKGGAPLKEIASIKEIIEESSLFVLRGSKSACKFSIAEDLWPAEIDIGQISQVINNIVINARQAMPEGGIIQVAAENLIIDNRHVLPLKPGRYIRVSIKDQGVGIAEKHFLNIFDPYFTTKQEGSGLGLATTYSIIKKHDGYITVESQIGIGTTFYIYLPASEKTVSEKEEDRLITGHGRILVMDDEASLRRTVGRVLQELGYEPEFAKDGAEAIEMFKKAKESKKPYDAVILDLTVPGGVGGMDTIEALLEMEPEVKAIVSSGYSDDAVLSNYQKYGFKSMLPKPFDPQSLSKVLHEVLKGGNDK